MQTFTYLPDNVLINMVRWQYYCNVTGIKVSLSSEFLYYKMISEHVILRQDNSDIGLLSVNIPNILV